jgi:hypothetical protein
MRNIFESTCKLPCLIRACKYRIQPLDKSVEIVTATLDLALQASGLDGQGGLGPCVNITAAFGREREAAQ